MEERFDDAVVGAGVLGLACAYHLARRGRRVAVFERSPRAEGASVRNFGMLWPIGQRAGEPHRLALRSLEVWSEVLPRAGLWHARAGSLHLAYAEDEAQVLREFAELAPGRGHPCEILGPEEALRRAPPVRREGLRAALWSPVEMAVDPREVLAGLPVWLAREYRVRFFFGTAARAYRHPVLEAGGKEWRAERLFACPGDDLATLYPEVLAGARLERVKLQMMRTEPLASLPPLPHLAAGLTLRHYPSFEGCPTLPALKERLARELPEHERYGIHVLVSRNGKGELTIGDSHEPAVEAGPFDRERIDALILDYLGRFLRVPGLRIASRWNGTYARREGEPWLVAWPAPGATVVTGVGGSGMTLSFGLMEKVVEEAPPAE